MGVDGAYLASLSDDQLTEVKALLKSKGLVFGGAGLPVEFRHDQAKFEETLKGLPKVASGLQRAGVDDWHDLSPRVRGWWFQAATCSCWMSRSERSMP